MTRKTLERPWDLFWSRVEVDEETGCWTWEHSRFLSGYGQTCIKGLPVRAHRAAWLFVYGFFTEGLKILHRCHKKECVNPEHLYEGTLSDNMADARENGRVPWFSLHPERARQAALIAWENTPAKDREFTFAKDPELAVRAGRIGGSR